MSNSSSDIHDTSYETLKLLNYIIHNDTICTNQISSILKNDKSERSNLRHFKTLQAFFQNEIGIEVFERTSRGCYHIVNKSTLEQALNLGDKKELLSYMQILKEVLPHYYATLDDEMKKSISRAEKEAELTYVFHNNPMEDFQNSDTLKQIEKSIEQKRRSNFHYVNLDYKDVKPLNIIFMEGNLYLACLTDDEINNGFKFLRVNEITNYSIDATEFNEVDKVLEARQFIKEFQTPFTSFQSEYIRVKMIASAEIARFFKHKKHLPSQEEKMLEDGGLEITYHVTSYMEISILVKKWIPSLKLVEPIDWRNKLNDELNTYLDNSTK